MSKGERPGDVAAGARRGSPVFASDRPIESPSADALDRFDFSKAVADAIQNWSGSDSLVVAISGAWGSGKSSVKNMALHYLRQTPDASPQIVEFNPWQLAGHDQLAGAFFREIENALRMGGADEDKKVAVRWATYAALVQAGAAAAPLLAETHDPLWSKIPLFATFISKVSTWWDRRAKQREKSLESRRKELIEELGKRKKPLLVVIDDIDRLDAEETRLMLKLVKGNASFPNFIYLLLFEREVVERSLDATTCNRGSEFLEKIIQVFLDVPAPDRARLEHLLFMELDQILDGLNLSQYWEQQRWGNLYWGGLNRYFDNIRDVRRYINTIRFQMGFLCHGGTPEVNPVDLVAIEVLRLFEPAVYNGILRAKSALLSTTFRMSGSPNPEAKQSILELLDLAPSRRRVVQEIIQHLFPQAGWVFDERSYIENQPDDWLKARRICSAVQFDKFFQLAVPSNDVSQSEIQHLLANTNRRDKLAEIFHSMGERNLLAVMMSRLDSYKEEIAIEHAVPFVTAMFDIADQLPKSRDSSTLINPSMHAWRIVYWFLLKAPSPRRRLEILKDAMSSTEGLSLPPFACQRELEPDVRAKKDGGKRLVTDDELEELRQIGLAHVDRLASAGKLHSNDKLGSILLSWAACGGLDKAKEWVAKIIHNDAGLRLYLRAFLVQSIVHGLSDRFGRAYWQIDLNSLERFVDPKEVEQRVMAMPTSDLAQWDALVLTTCQRAYRLRADGKSPSWAFEDEDIPVDASALK
jgi:predicted KAP-like P-loop ATPase